MRFDLRLLVSERASEKERWGRCCKNRSGPLQRKLYALDAGTLKIVVDKTHLTHTAEERFRR